MNAFTTDAFFNGRILIKQSRSGYRFSIDAVLLAYYACPRPGDKVVDLGTGCGIIPVILAYRYPDLKVYGIEIQNELAEIAAANVEENQLKGRVDILCMNMKELESDRISGPADLVVTNPPYRRAKSGRINPDQQRAVARHEVEVALFDVIETACRILHPLGRFVMVYPAERMTDILTRMRTAGIEPKLLRMIHSGRDAEAKLVLAEGVKGGRAGMKICPPLIIYRENGTYTEEVKKMFFP